MAQLIFDVAIEPLQRLAKDLAPDDQARLTREGFPTGALEPGYPAERWGAWVNLIAKALHPDTERVEAQRRVGLAVTGMFVETVRGQVLFGLLRLLGPKRALDRLTRNMRTANNFVEATVVPKGPTDFEISLNEVNDAPGFYRGLFDTGLAHSGAPGVVTEVLSCNGHAAVIRLHW